MDLRGRAFKVFSISVFVAAAALWTLYVAHGAVLLRKTKQELLSARRSAKAAGADLVRLREVRKSMLSRLYKMTSAFDEISRSVPGKKKIPDTVAAIARLGRDRGLEIVSVLPREKDLFRGRWKIAELGGETFFFLPLQVTARGDFAQMGEFLISLKKMPNFCCAGRTSIRKSRKRGSGRDLLLDAEIFFIFKVEGRAA